MVLSNAALVWSLIYHVMANGTVVGVFYDAAVSIFAWHWCLN